MSKEDWSWFLKDPTVPRGLKAMEGADPVAEFVEAIIEAVKENDRGGLRKLAEFVILSLKIFDKHRFEIIEKLEELR